MHASRHRHETRGGLVIGFHAVQRLSRTAASRPDAPGERSEVLRAVLAQGSVDEATRSRAELISTRTRQPVEQVLNQLGALSDDDLCSAYAQVTGLKVWEPASQPPIAALSQSPISVEFMRRRRLILLSSEPGRVLCALCDPLDQEAIGGVAFATGAPVDLLVARPLDWSRAFEALAIQEQRAPADHDQHRLDRDVDQLSDFGSTGAGSRIVASAFDAAIKLGASDIHFEPRRNDMRVRLRVDGMMVDHLTVSTDQAAAAVSRVKVIADLDVGERRLPQDGRTSFVFGGRSVDVRVATSPTVFGESAVLRILDRSTVPLNLPSLGLSPKIAELLEKAARSPHGMFLISGPTGSGKTTTLYALLQGFAGSPKKVLSVEDPVEFHFDHVTQTQVAPGIGLSFASALRSFLRQDPDVILVGEIRDAETASVAVQAAMTGHLLLASVHANDALAVVPRLLDMGIEPFQLAAGLRGAAAQRLVRRLCPHCAEDRPVTVAQAGFIEACGMEPPPTLRHTPGCPQCNGQGFKGRLAICEAFLADEPFIRAVAAGASAADLGDLARAAGFHNMAFDAAAKVCAGLTTVEEVVGVLHA